VLLKNMMVHLDQSPESGRRLEMAVAIAQRHQARLVGVFGQRSTAVQVGVVATWPTPEYVEAAKASKAGFEAAVGGLLQAEWHDINRGSDAALLNAIPHKAHYFDLIVVGQHREGQQWQPPELVEVLLLHSGRPALIVPYVGGFRSEFKRPLIAWNDSRESAQALNDALPLIQGCGEAVILGIDIRPGQAQASCLEVARHLACHGIAARTEVLIVEDIGVMDMLLNRVSDHGADLLILGAHSQLGFPFVRRDEGTRHILRTMTVPTLMAS
jgi:nucleotide-binding universal stress UspA family protein